MTHSEYENVHRHWRDRYGVGPDNLALRPKRRGIHWQQLRASAALAVEWLRISVREGWLGSARRNRHDDGWHAKRFQEGFDALQLRIADALDEFDAKRKKARLHLPYKRPPTPTKRQT